MKDGLGGAFSILKVKTYSVLVGELEGNRPLGRLTRWWELNTKMEIEKMASGVTDWIRMSHD